MYGKTSPHMYKPYIVWLGGVFDESTMLKNVAISLAANIWQKGFINALQNLGINIVTLGHLYEPLWPKGRLRINKNEATIANGLEGRLISYWNFPEIRKWSLKRKYLKEFNHLCATEGKPISLLSYNIYSYIAKVGLYAQRELNIPWICIVADALNPNPQDKWHNAMLKTANGRVFLSWAACKDSTYSPKLHLDGGINNIKQSLTLKLRQQDVRKKVVLYSGGISYHGGINFLIEGFRKVKNPNVELWICGKGIKSSINKKINSDPRIKFLGLLSETEFDEICQTAYIFINPRPSSLIENRYNFPSKVLGYLSYGKPVVTTWTGGLSPEYREILVILKEETAGCLADTIEDVLNWPEQRRQELTGRIRGFLETKKMWSIQANKFLEWLTSEVYPRKIESYK